VIEVGNRPDGGARFTVLLPVTEADAAASAVGRPRVADPAEGDDLEPPTGDEPPHAEVANPGTGVGS
jgi:hypothetical protein